MHSEASLMASSGIQSEPGHIQKWQCPPFTAFPLKLIQSQGQPKYTLKQMKVLLTSLYTVLTPAYY